MPAEYPWIQGIAQNVSKTWTGWRLPFVGYSVDQYEYSFDLESPVNLSANTTYWLALYFVDHITEPAWQETETAFGYPLAYEDSGPTDGAYTWSAGIADHAFYLTGYTPIPEQIDDILDFFDEAVEEGTLVGNGPTPTSSDGKLNAFWNMLLQADYLIGIDDIQAACTQLHDAYEKTDGITTPPDFVAGTAAEELATMIQGLMESLGCD